MMLARDTVGKKEEKDMKRQYRDIWFGLLILIKHTAENLDK